MRPIYSWLLGLGVPHQTRRNFRRRRTGKETKKVETGRSRPCDYAKAKHVSFTLFHEKKSLVGKIKNLLRSSQIIVIPMHTYICCRVKLALRETPLSLKPWLKLSSPRATSNTVTLREGGNILVRR